jgi:anaerobic selenocysteine-containing dehydrogenase
VRHDTVVGRPVAMYAMRGISAHSNGFQTCRALHLIQMLLGALCAGDPARFKALRVRFSSPVYPGDTLRLSVWHDGPGRVTFEAKVGDRTVVSNAYFEFA